MGGRHNHRECVYQIEVLDFDGEHENALRSFDTPGAIKKLADRSKVAVRKTRIGRFLNPHQAKRWGSKKGSVVGCHKVDIEPYLKNIEHLRLDQELPAIEVAQEFTLSPTLELTETTGEKISVNMP